MLAVTGLERTDVAKDRAAKQSQISYQVKYLVPDEFVILAESIFVEYRFADPVNSYDVFQCTPKSQAVCP